MPTLASRQDIPYPARNPPLDTGEGWWVLMSWSLILVIFGLLESLMHVIAGDIPQGGVDSPDAHVQIGPNRFLVRLHVEKAG